MNTLSRLRYVLSANVNALLEKAEDPDKLLRALLREMQEVEAEGRRALTDLTVEIKAAERDLDDAGAQIERLETSAAEAVDSDDDARARRLLQEKQTTEAKITALQDQLDKARSRHTTLQGDVARVAEKIGEIRQKTASGPGSTRPRAPTTRIDRTLNRFDELEQRIGRLEARVEAYDDTNIYPPVEASKPDPRIEAELEKLRKKVSA